MAVTFTKPSELDAASTVTGTAAIIVDNGTTVEKATPRQIVDAGRPVSSEAQAVEGTDNQTTMTPLTVKQAIDADTSGAVAQAQAWAESDTAPGDPGTKSAKTWAGESGGYATAAAESAAKAELFDGPKFNTIADMALYEDAEDGDVATVLSAFNGGVEHFDWIAGSTLTADGALVVDGVGGQWVSKRTVYADDAEFQSDPRPDGFFDDGQIVHIAEKTSFALQKVSIGESRTTDGGAKWKVLPGIMGYIVEQFGVDGSASAADKAAWVVATDTAVADGVKLNGTAGATYLFNPTVNDRLNIAIGEGQSFTLDLHGATIKYADGMTYTAGKFWHMIHVVMRSIYGTTNSTAENVEIRNFTVDGNLRGQTAPEIGTVLAEQWAAVKVQVVGADGNRLKRCLIENYIQVDPIADSIQIGPSSADDFDLDGDGYFESATIGAVILNNGHAGKRNSVRAFISLGSGCGDIIIDGVTCDITDTSETNSIETEFSSIGEQFVNVKISNVYIDDIELGGKTGTEDQFNIELTNVTTLGFFLAGYANVKAADCRLRISLPNTQRIKNFYGSNVTFIHTVFDDGGVQDVYPLNMTAPEISSWKEVNCKHVIEGVLDAAANNALFKTGNEANADYGKNIYEFVQTEFDPLCPIAIDGYAGGIVKTNGCTMGGKTYAVQTGAAATFSGGWHSKGDDFTKVTGLSFRLLGNLDGAPAEIRIDGGAFPSLNYNVTGSFYKQLFKQSSRVLQSASAASGGGIVGDTIQLTDAAYTAAASTSPVMWRCVASHPTAATWVPILNKP